MAKIPLSTAVATLQKSNPAYSIAVGFLMGKDGPQKDLANAYVEMYRKYHDLSTDYTMLYSEASALLDENEFMVKTLSEECNK